MKQRDQRRQQRLRPYSRKIHFPDGEVWSYRFTGSVVAIRTPDCETTHQVPLPEISGMSWDLMERGRWKQWWKGVGPGALKEYILFHLRPDPREVRIPGVAFMHPRFFGRWHYFRDCPVLPHRKHGQKYDPAQVPDDDLEHRLGEKPTLRNLCGTCMRTYQARFRCMDCRKPDIEYYMVWDALWAQAVPDREGQLCLVCLGKRLGRPLRRGDFPPSVPLNQFAEMREHIARLAP